MEKQPTTTPAEERDQKKLQARHEVFRLRDDEEDFDSWYRTHKAVFWRDMRKDIENETLSMEENFDLYDCEEAFECDAAYANIAATPVPLRPEVLADCVTRSLLRPLEGDDDMRELYMQTKEKVLEKTKTLDGLYFALMQSSVTCTPIWNISFFSEMCFQALFHSFTADHGNYPVVTYDDLMEERMMKQYVKGQDS